MSTIPASAMHLVRVLFFALCATMLGTAAFAQDDQNVLQARMKARVPQIDELKLAGLVGENNKGFLEQRGALEPAQTEIMNAENTDRRALYNILAGRLGVTSAVLGEQRAATVRDRSAAGIWLQGADGVWYQK